MKKNLPDKPHKDKKLVSIGEAVDILGVSIDTLRRWDKNGTLKSVRPDGKNRFFPLEDIENLKFSKPLSIGEASKQLDLSTSTLRRLEEKGFIEPIRNKAGERLYTKDSLDRFLHSEYYLRQKQVEEKILEPLKKPEEVTETSSVTGPKINPKTTGSIRVLEAVASEAHQKSVENEEKILETREKILEMMEGALENREKSLENKKKLIKIWAINKAIFSSGLFLVLLFLFSTGVIAASFIIYPEETAKFFGYGGRRETYKYSTNVLGVTDSPLPSKEVKPNVVGSILKPVSGVSLELVSHLKPDTYKQIVKIENVNDVFNTDDSGNLLPKENIKLPDSSYLIVPDKGLISNLNAEWLRGRTWGGEPGSLLALDEKGDLSFKGVITSKSVGGEAIIDGSVTEADLGNDSVNSNKIQDESITGDDIKDGSIENKDLENSSLTVKAGDGLTDGGEVELGEEVTLNIGEGDGVSVEDEKIGIKLTSSGTTGDASSNSGLEVSSSGLTLLKGCTDGQILKWNNSTNVWYCTDDTGGGGSSVWSDLLAPTANLSLSHDEYETTFNWNTASTAAALDAYSLSITNDASTDSTTQRVLVITNEAATGGTTENLLVLDNADDSTVTTALQVLGSSTGAITTALDVSDDQIVTALSIGNNDITTSGATISATELNLLDSGIALSELTDSGTLTSSTVDINGGNIDGTAIGAASPSTGAFTTLSSTGATTLGNDSSTVAINSSVWDITTLGVTTGLSISGSTNTLSNIPNSALTNSSLTINTGVGLSGGGSVSLGGSLTLQSKILTSADGIGSSSSFSGLDFQGSSDDSLTLLQGCTNNQILKWNDGSGIWVCSADATGGGTGSLDDSYDNGGTITVDAYDVLFNLSDSTNDFKFTIDNATSGVITSAFAVTTTGGGSSFTNAIDLSDSDIVNALTLGQNYILYDGIREYSPSTGTLVIEDISGNDLLSLVDGGAISIGSTAVGTTQVVVATDGTGDSEVVLPTGSISGTEILDDSVVLGIDTDGSYVASFTAGGGLTGDASGEGSAPTLAVGAGTGITVNANDVAVDQSYAFTWTGTHTFTNGTYSALFTGGNVGIGTT